MKFVRINHRRWVFLAALAGLAVYASKTKMDADTDRLRQIEANAVNEAMVSALGVDPWRGTSIGTMTRQLAAAAKSPAEICEEESTGLSTRNETDISSSAPTRVTSMVLPRVDSDVPLSDLVVTNLMFHAVRRFSDRAELGLAWPYGANNTNRYIEIFSSSDLTNHWFYRGKVDAWAVYSRSNVVVSVTSPSVVTNSTVFFGAAWDVDSDHDYLTDGQEHYVTHTDPHNPDHDGDGLLDGEEIGDYGTDPFNPDTDGDGIGDLWDSYYGDPNNPDVPSRNFDTDHDGLSDYDEARLETDFEYADTDNDGLNDGWEVEHGFDPLDNTGDNGGSGDPDHDGLTNSNEQFAHTDPRNPDSDGDGIPDGVDRRPLLPDAFGYGQGTDWVCANFINDANTILARGYSDWVNDQIGVGLENGLCKLTASFQESPAFPVLLYVGNNRVMVDSAGDYSFCLDKGVKYEFGTYPFVSNVVYTVVDDLEPAAPHGRSIDAPDTLGAWTSDGGFLNMRYPLAPIPGVFVWFPTLRGSPDIEHIDPRYFPMTFSAELTDYRGLGSVEYQWSTSDSENVHIATPNARQTQVSVSSLPRWDQFSLRVEATIAGHTLLSALRTSYGTSRTPQVTISLSVPEVVFTNDDDDDDNGVPDYRLVTNSMFSPDDDIAEGEIVVHSDIATNATVTIERISGFDSGFADDVTEFLYLDSGCTQPLREGHVFDYSGKGPVRYSFYINAVVPSVSYNDIEIVVRLRLEDGAEQIARANATIVKPIVEPICNETKEVASDGETRTLTYNPCGVAIGEEAYFKIRVEPEDFPNNKIIWEAEGGLVFVGGNRGREVCVRGITAGTAKLNVRLRTDDVQVPSFSVLVVPMTTIPIYAMVVCDGDRRPVSNERINHMIKMANDIYTQVGMQFYLAELTETNLPAAYAIAPSSVTNDIGNVWRHSQLTSLLPSRGGVECYFVKSIVGSDGRESQTIGLASDSGIAITSSAYDTTLAHEIGHLCGADDIYDGNGGAEVGPNDYICYDNSIEDWNNGCSGRGASGSRYYPTGLNMSDIIPRLLMYGYGGESRRDITLGYVYGVRDDGSVCAPDDVSIGFKNGNSFRQPVCR